MNNLFIHEKGKGFVLRVISFIFRNLGYLYKIYKASFYFESYFCMCIGLSIIALISGDSIWDVKEFIIADIITYPFTRFFYYSCKEYIIGNVTWNGIILRYLFKCLTFMLLFSLSFIPGTCCILYILLNENSKEYNRRKAFRNTDNLGI